MNVRGGSRIFSRGGGGAEFQKISKNFCDDLFFRLTKLIFRSPKAVNSPCFGHIFCAAGKFLKKQVKKKVFGKF